MYRSYITHANDIGLRHLEEPLHDQLLYMVQGTMEVSMPKVFFGVLVLWISLHPCLLNVQLKFQIVDGLHSYCQLVRCSVPCSFESPSCAGLHFICGQRGRVEERK